MNYKMRKVSIPKLEFSPWYKWEKRNSYPLCNYPGVYLIAITKQELEGKKPCFQDVVYIGMTKQKNGLKGRWQNFQSAISGKEGHSGGIAIYNEKGAYEEWTEKLYVSAMRIKCNVINSTSVDYIKMGWVAFLEYDAFAKYAEEVGGHPKYNTQ